MLNIYFSDLLIVITFIIGYFLITIEHTTRVNKTSIALLMAILCWAFLFVVQRQMHENYLSQLNEHLANISQIVFFLLGALTIVEIINAHKGFRIISRVIRITSKRKLLWLVGAITFFLSSVLDNLTTTIIMVTLLRKLIQKGEERLIMGGAVVIAANAGGAWTPIGDVTTTMLWIGGQISTLEVMRVLFLPSFACLVVALAYLNRNFKGKLLPPDQVENEEIEPMGTIVFWLGLTCLISVPFFKVLTGLPPFMGIILGLGLIWLFTDLVHSRYDKRHHLRVPHVMTQIDVSGVLFFLGILLCIDALQTAGLLDSLAKWMDRQVANADLVAISIGLVSAIVDNVPLVAATMGMYSLSQYPIDSCFWNLIAYCAGTGGSILVIGSAAGVAFMGLERVQFFWYFRRVGIAAALGYFAGIGVFKLLELT